MLIVSDSPTFAPVQTWFPPWGLSTCIRAVMVRSTVGLDLPASARWAHYPVSPTCSLNGLFSGVADLLDAGAAYTDDAPRQRVSGLTVTGPQTRPRTVYYEGQAHGVMVVFYPDAWHALTGTTLASLTDQVLDANTVLPRDLLQASQRMFEPAADDDQRVKRFFDDLLPIWKSRMQDSRHDRWSSHEWSRALTPWVESLALRAAATGWGRSLRQSERRIKEWTGWPLRRLHGSVRGEAVFFAAMAALMDNRVDWVEIALDHGFADQSHFIREIRRLTGFTPEALRYGILNEEAFWSYRAWAQLAGYSLPNRP